MNSLGAGDSAWNSLGAGDSAWNSSTEDTKSGSREPMVSLSLKQWETMLVVSSWVLSLVPGDCGEDVELAGCMNTDWRLILLLKLLLTLCDILLADPCSSLKLA